MLKFSEFDQWDSKSDKIPWGQAWRLKFNPWDLHNVGREATPWSCPLASMNGCHGMCAATQSLKQIHTHIHILNKNWNPEYYTIYLYQTFSKTLSHIWMNKYLKTQEHQLWIKGDCRRPKQLKN